PWVATQGVSAHWLRHTTLTWVERTHGYAVAQAYAGHSGGRTADGVTATYVRATLHEVATALAALSGEPHPLAPPARCPGILVVTVRGRGRGVAGFHASSPVRRGDRAFRGLLPAWLSAGRGGAP
ncbi:MAG TPA: hypothetical protein VI248_28355, partial [Kineosporiaceae bacterium]